MSSTRFSWAGARKLLGIALLFAAVLPSLATEAGAAGHMVVKVEGETISFPAGFETGDTLIVSASKLGKDDWNVLRTAEKKYSLVLVGMEDMDLRSALSGCQKITAFIATDLTRIWSSTFSGCTQLVSVSMPNGESIAREAFSGCTSLKSVFLPSVTAVHELSFQGCSSLESIELPALKTVYGDAFIKCESLKSLSMPQLDNYLTSNYNISASETKNLSVMELGAKPPTLDKSTFSVLSGPLLSLVPKGKEYNSASGTTAFFSEIGSVAGKNETTRGPSIVKPGGTINLVSGLPSDSFSSFQWQLEGDDIPGASEANYTKQNAQAADSGLYTLTFKHNNNAHKLAAIRVVVGEAPLIDGEAEKVVSDSGSLGENMEISLSLAGTPSPTVAFWGTLPKGMKSEYEEGVIKLTGTPEETGTFVLRAFALNDITKYSGGGSLAKLAYTLTVKEDSSSGQTEDGEKDTDVPDQTGDDEKDTGVPSQTGEGEKDTGVPAQTGEDEKDADVPAQTEDGEKDTDVPVQTEDSEKDAETSDKTDGDEQEDGKLTINLSALGLVNGTLIVAAGEDARFSIASEPAGGSFSALGLPAGMTISQHGVLSGAASMAGDYRVNVTAILGDLIAAESFVIRVIDSPEDAGSGGCDSSGMGASAALLLAILGTIVSRPGFARSGKQG